MYFSVYLCMFCISTSVFSAKTISVYTSKRRINVCVRGLKAERDTDGRTYIRISVKQKRLLTKVTMYTVCRYLCICVYIYLVHVMCIFYYVQYNYIFLCFSSSCTHFGHFRIIFRKSSTPGKSTMCRHNLVAKHLALFRLVYTTAKLQISPWN